MQYNFSLDDVSGHMRLSGSHICQEFQEYMKTTIMAFVRAKRVMYANSLLKKGQKPNDVYKDCGFADYSTFFRAYKRILGQSPSNRRVAANTL